MAENSKIEWTDHTFNPWVGCQQVSEGCANCYAERFMTRKTRWRNAWGPPVLTQRLKTSDANWKKPLTWNRKAEKSGIRYKVFCGSLCDVFEDNRDVEEWRRELVTLIDKTPHLDWLLLTKRPENIGRLWPEAWPWPENIWIGTSVENQKTADERIPHLVKVPVKVKFVSCEPLLGKVDLQLRGRNYGIDDEYVNWVIAGGESGPNARPMNPDWVRYLRDQCQEMNVPFFFKQWGEWGPNALYPIGKKKAGRELDGRTWEEASAPLSERSIGHPPKFEDMNLGGTKRN